MDFDDDPPVDLQERLTVLHQRDYLIGVQAQLATVRHEILEMRKRHETVGKRVALIREDRDRCVKRAAELERQVEAIESSRTWRTGRAVLRRFGRGAAKELR